MLHFLELEETVGKLWHRLVGDTASYPRHPEHGVTLDEVRGRLGVFFRGLGGEATVQLSAAGARTSGHRLKLRQRIGLGEERLEQAGRDTATLFLPPRLDLFPDPRLNRALYSWLAAYFVHLPTSPLPETDPLRRDLAALRRARETVETTLRAYPGLAHSYAELCAALRALRPRRSLPPAEAEVEQLVLSLLGDRSVSAAWLESDAPVGYQPFLPVPLWGEALVRPEGEAPRDTDELGGGGKAAEDTRKRAATRRNTDQARRDDPMAINRFEKILAMAEMVNVNRAADDDEDEHAEKAADDLEELTVAKHQGKPATKLKFDLDLPPEAVDTSRLTADLTYPEWDYTRRCYQPDACRVLAAPASEDGESWTPDAAAQSRIRRVRRQFEALRPKLEVLRAQVDGHDLDIEALVRARADLKAGGVGNDRVHMALRRQEHDLAVALLVDVSLSTDAWVDDRRVLDVEKEALLVLSHGLAAVGDDHAIYTFTSRRRSWVRVETVKDFDEPLSGAVTRRIAALRPGYYTRIGAAIRHATAQLAKRPNRQRLLLVVTDGKPNDVDHYEGRFGIEDTRRAVIEARRAGLAVFGVTVDRQAQEYFPMLFGRGGYAIVGHIAKLPTALPAIYRHLVG
jgi:nitric oxide reductase NorD protein